MNTPKTSTGKPCKLCLKKGGSCHLHSPNQSTRKSSRSASPKKSSPKMVLDDIHLPALQEILLKLDRETLNSLCSSNKQAYKICSEKTFQMLYDAIHPKKEQMTFGELKMTKDIHKDLIFTDERGTRIMFEKEKGDGIKILYSPKGQGLEVQFELRRSSKYKDPVLRLSLRDDADFASPSDFLKSIGKLRWLKGTKKPVGRNLLGHKIETTEFSRVAAIEFLSLVKKLVGSNVPDIFF